MVKAQIPVSPIGLHQLLSKQFPHGRPVDLAPSNRHSGPPMDPTNVSLRLSNGKLTKIYERVEKRDHQVLWQKRDDDASIMTAKVQKLQILALPVVELVASRFQLEDGSWSDVTYADDVDIGPRTGHVYFSDATDVKLDRDLKTGKWDIWYPSKLEGIRGLKSGRLLRYKPETGEVDLIASGALFANGVAVDAQERFVVFTSTFEGKVMKYHLTGEKEGQLETILTDFQDF
ncbi:hypothetical protein QTG54_004568 [Skeletonema marinoi]|uniref:Strictosidine synthase conserved region domain-containing protein n=1 Tax=Skeletonema marinoi TaxID=267567 RepID=A0AAD8YFK1_9STRA|nr:hypothetical protein QTG54_004568 [Skeletonema marinoi]